jgi:hypothetical protein
MIPLINKWMDDEVPLRYFFQVWYVKLASNLLYVISIFALMPILI